MPNWQNKASAARYRKSQRRTLPLSLIWQHKSNTVSLTEFETRSRSMLWSIDQKKVREVLKELKPRYSVSYFSIEALESHRERMPLFSVSGTVSGEMSLSRDFGSDL